MKITIAQGNRVISVELDPHDFVYITERILNSPLIPQLAEMLVKAAAPSLSDAEAAFREYLQRQTGTETQPPSATITAHESGGAEDITKLFKPKEKKPNGKPKERET